VGRGHGNHFLVSGVQVPRQREKGENTAMKNFLYGCLVGAMVIFIVYTLFDGAAREQAQREANQQKYKDCAEAKTGQHCFVNGREAVIVTARGAK
jgi:hypothetical protein